VINLLLGVFALLLSTFLPVLTHMDGQAHEIGRQFVAMIIPHLFFTNKSIEQSHQILDPILINDKSTQYSPPPLRATPKAATEKTRASSII
jgi:hypothetical protein